MNKIPALLTLAALACTAHAEDKLGVPVYPGAKAHAQDTAAAKMLASEAYCFRSPDAVAKLVAYYKAQPGLKLMPMPPGVVAVATADAPLTLELPGRLLAWIYWVTVVTSLPVLGMTATAYLLHLVPAAPQGAWPQVIGGTAKRGGERGEQGVDFVG